MEMRVRMLRGLAVGALVILGGYQTAVSWQYVERIRWPDNFADPGFSVTTPWPSVGRVSARAAEAGLRAGDRLLEVQGQPYAGEAARFGALEKLFVGDRIRVTVAGRREASWRLEAGGGGRIAAALLGILVPVGLLGIGFWGVFARGAWVRLGVLAGLSHWVAEPAFFKGPFYEMHSLVRGALPLFLYLAAGGRGWPVGALLGGAVAMTGERAMRDWGEPARWAGWIDAMAPVAWIWERWR